MNNPRKCIMCKKQVQGRADKIFCDYRCKNLYHTKLRAVTFNEAKAIDEHLHRNRSILLELMGKHVHQVKIPRVKLEKKRFRFGYSTHFNVNTRGKTVYHVYDFSWVTFSDDEVLINRKRKKPINPLSLRQ